MDLTNALSNYQAGRFPDVGPNCFKCIEGLGREILLNNNNLDNNKADIFKYMEFSSRWNSMFSNFIPYIHEHRHASEGRHDLKNIELESMLYMTCLFVRAICLIYIEKKIAQSNYITSYDRNAMKILIGGSHRAPWIGLSEKSTDLSVLFFDTIPRSK